MGSLAAQLAFIPAGLTLALLARECCDVYRKIYIVVKYRAHVHGARFDADAAPAAWSARALAPPATGAATGVATLFVARSALERVLLASVTSASRNRLFDAPLSAAELRRARPSLARIWALVGPATATRATWRELGRVHGRALVSLGLAALWAVCVAPVAHAQVEAALAPKRVTTAPR